MIKKPTNSAIIILTKSSGKVVNVPPLDTVVATPERIDHDCRFLRIYRGSVYTICWRLAFQGHIALAHALAAVYAGTNKGLSFEEIELAL